MTRLLLAVFFTLSITASHADQIGETVQSDLNNDGIPEVFSLIDNYEGSVDLVISQGDVKVVAKEIAWLGGFGQEPYLDLAQNGSVQLHSGNESVGRNRWTQTLTIAYRKYAYRVAGYTYSWYDTLDLDDFGSCDINLLNGRGILANGETKTNVSTDYPALNVVSWAIEQTIPSVCKIDH